MKWDFKVSACDPYRGRVRCCKPVHSYGESLPLTHNNDLWTNFIVPLLTLFYLNFCKGITSWTWPEAEATSSGRCWRNFRLATERSPISRRRPDPVAARRVSSGLPLKPRVKFFNIFSLDLDQLCRPFIILCHINFPFSTVFHFWYWGLYLSSFILYDLINLSNVKSSLFSCRSLSTAVRNSTVVLCCGIVLWLFVFKSEVPRLYRIKQNSHKGDWHD